MKLRLLLSGTALFACSIGANACPEQGDSHNGADHLQVTESSLNFSQDNGEKVITTIGKMKNAAAARAEEIVVEVKYFDAKNRLVDVVTQPLFGVVVPASQEVAFRVRDAADKPKEAYASSTVRVVSAEQRIVRPAKPKQSTFSWTELLVSWAPMLLLIAVWIYFMRKYTRKDSPQRRSVELIEQQNTTLARQLEVLERLAAAAEKAASAR